MDCVLKETTKALLSSAKDHANARGSNDIREEDVQFAIELFTKQSPEQHEWYRIPVAGNGDCLCKLIVYVSGFQYNF